MLNYCFTGKFADIHLQHVNIKQVEDHNRRTEETEEAPTVPQIFSVVNCIDLLQDKTIFAET